MPQSLIYMHHAIGCEPRAYAEAAHALIRLDWASRGAALYGVWRAQIGRPRDELTAITVWTDPLAAQSVDEMVGAVPQVREVASESLIATLRPVEPVAPRRQGNYAFRWFELPVKHWTEFSALCQAAWPGFESAYDSQVIGLWRCLQAQPDRVRSLLLTRRPNLAMWERSKIPQGTQESEVRRILSRRYDLCDDTWVHTATLITAEDHVDEARWT